MKNKQIGIGGLVKESAPPQETETFYKIMITRVPVVREKTYQLTSPNLVAKKYLEYFKKLDREHFEILHLDTKNKITAKEIISIGSLNSSIVHPREVFKGAILNNSASIILLHNHPSGDTKPSREDISITQRLIKAGEILGIKVIDHLILGDSFLSFKEEGII